MIQLNSDDVRPHADACIHDEVDEFFKPGGTLQGACEHEEFPYEPRVQQREMADAVADAMDQYRHLIVEAGTGVGKSFAYLVPAILAAKQHGTKVVVSTYTISLQEQLMYKDIPFLQEHMDIDFKAVLVKGRDNYLCKKRLQKARRLGKDLFRKQQEAELEAIWRWSESTGDGSRQSMDTQPSPDVWGQVNAEEGICTLGGSRSHADCPLHRARAHMADADLLIVNHHLLFSELAMRAQGGAFLPPYGIAVIDEAHQSENVASEHFGLRVSFYQFDYWLRRLYAEDTNKGLLAVLKKGPEAHEVSEIRKSCKAFFEEMAVWANFSAKSSQRVATKPIDISTTLPGRLGRLCSALRTLATELEDEDMRAEIQVAYRKGLGMKEALESFLNQLLEGHVYWVEQEGRKRQTVLYSAPIEVGPVLEKHLFGGIDAVVMTSATLSVNKSMDYFKQRVGARGVASLEVGSPFNYARQMRLVVPKDMPDPTQEEKFGPAAIKAIDYFVKKSNGRAFVLFTNTRLMRKVVDALQGPLTRHGLRLLVQGTGLPRHTMLEKFKREPRTVLFGLDSFWMGVDVRGEALSSVIITRLPFSVPDHPVIKARMDRIRENGGEPFKEYALPEAILKFRQGVGRLIRTAEDTGEVVILDARILKKWYGKLFFQSLPECEVDIVELNQT